MNLDMQRDKLSIMKKGSGPSHAPASQAKREESRVSVEQKKASGFNIDDLNSLKVLEDKLD